MRFKGNDTNEGIGVMRVFEGIRVIRVLQVCEDFEGKYLNS